MARLYSALKVAKIRRCFTASANQRPWRPSSFSNRPERKQKLNKTKTCKRASSTRLLSRRTHKGTTMILSGAWHFLELNTLTLKMLVGGGWGVGVGVLIRPIKLISKNIIKTNKQNKTTWIHGGSRTFNNLFLNLNPGVTFVSWGGVLSGSTRLVNVNSFSFDKKRDGHARVIRGGPFDSDEGWGTGTFWKLLFWTLYSWT